MISSHISSVPPTQEITSFYVPNDLNIKTRALGYKVEIAQLASTAPYSLFIDQLRGYKDTLIIQRRLTKSTFKRATIDRSFSKFSLEMKDIETNSTVALLTLDLKSKDQLTINGLGVSKVHQRKGLGTILINHSIEIAKQLKLKKIQLQSDHASISFYKKMGMAQIPKSNLMQLDIPHAISNYALGSMSPKKLSQVVSVLGVSKYLP